MLSELTAPAAYYVVDNNDGKTRTSGRWIGRVNGGRAGQPTPTRYRLSTLRPGGIAFVPESLNTKKTAGLF